MKDENVAMVMEEARLVREYERARFSSLDMGRILYGTTSVSGFRH